ncbi:SUMF1/EgtB/PvdO family nonheme iron enzyme [Paenibacillus humicola]|uniref:SUMF1/EgtB/PvdO family nonheme iron enzyme n=1 Tax=Paenibacillus humicola TaxID=3110540 RepID=UPI00237C3B47|nr:SUMF1/EgtB/PvdO family nonheme iron enzyme [Paenibacillus humicola]
MRFSRDAEEYINTIGMVMRRVQAGTFRMGSENGDPDERPVHAVRISQSFHMAAYEVTNAQYEQFDPGHRKLRGKLGFSRDNEEAVIFVSWHEAQAFCEWLTKKEGLPYRLPTEAEWEYAARAGSETAYSMGDVFPRSQHKNQRESWFPDPDRSRGGGEIVPLTVGCYPPNAWGLYDLHGNVEEWVGDWYGPFEAETQEDPVGRADGDFKVTRGGSHQTWPYYLRSANRLGTIPEDKHWLIGFRVVLGDRPATNPLPTPSPPQWQRNVLQHVPPDVNQGPDSEQPYFLGPRRYAKVVPGKKGPLYIHNHVGDVTETPNGDLIAVWYSTTSEAGREMLIAGSRLRYGAAEWDDPCVVWDAPDRNMSGAALFWDEATDVIYHFCGLGAAGTWGNIALVMRTSRDNGATWSKGAIIGPEHGRRTMPLSSVFKTKDGEIVLSCDAVTGSDGGTALWVSANGGVTWRDAGGTIAGIHAPAAELEDGRFIAFGRGDNIGGKMPKSLSSDKGRTWTYEATEFDPLLSGQRAALIRLREGPLFLATFTSGMDIIDAAGRSRRVKGMMGFLSMDNGESWPYRRLITDDGPGQVWDGQAWTGRFMLSAKNAEPKGYFSVIQTRNGLIHLFSSALHYTFNLKWLMTPPPSEEEMTFTPWK